MFLANYQYVISFSRFLVGLRTCHYGLLQFFVIVEGKMSHRKREPSPAVLHLYQYSSMSSERH
jgi:hypothetical protein